MLKAKTPTGYVIYRGPSLLDGKPIFVVALTSSKNRKTGDVVQTYILVDNEFSAVENAASLADESICGVCPHRRGLGGACYVNLGHGPNIVAKAFKKGNYPNDPKAAMQASKGKIVRLGTYGDPAAVPADVWHNLLSLASGHLGYTHQWKNGKASHVMGLCMASADSASERDVAKSMGYRTFRVRTSEEPLNAGEFACPASAEMGKKKTCETCKACSGGVNTKKADPAIIVHGSVAKRFIPIAVIA